VSSISTHILDSATGRPAAAVEVVLEALTAGEADGGDSWHSIGTGRTDVDGRLKVWGPASFDVGDYRLVFHTREWFAAQGRECFYPQVIIAFTVADDGHYHVPLLLAPYAYSTYRGS
jgi:5-hydroxyisourate hydrolase